MKVITLDENNDNYVKLSLQQQANIKFIAIFIFNRIFISLLRMN